MRIQTLYVAALAALLALSAHLHARPARQMPDIKQNARPEWGKNWCAPTAVGNSFFWLAKENNLPDLVKNIETGQPYDGEELVEDLGVMMGTDPAKGTTGDQIEDGKKQWIHDRGLDGRVVVERKKNPTKKWLKDQFNAGQDVEMAFGYFKKLADGSLERIGGHTQVLYGELPGEDAGGHALSLVSILDPTNSDADSDFQVTFTDPGRDDLAGQFGCIASEQYSVLDPVGNPIFCTASTYNMRFVEDFFEPGRDAYVLEGYTGLEGGLDARVGEILKVLEDGFAESPVPEPAATSLVLVAAIMFSSSRRHRR